jgi:hypothetical protein
LKSTGHLIKNQMFQQLLWRKTKRRGLKIKSFQRLGQTKHEKFAYLFKATPQKS